MGGSNYPATKNIQTQSTGFGSLVQKFQLAKGKSKYGMPIFLPNGNINPAYLAAERKAMASQSKKNVAAQAGKTKKMKAAKTFELGDFIAKTVGKVTDGKAYYERAGKSVAREALLLPALASHRAAREVAVLPPARVDYSPR